LHCQSIKAPYWFTEIKNYSTIKKLTTMYALKNKVQLIGNVGNNVEVKTIESGKKLVKFSIATNESYKNNTGEKVTETTWHNVVAWGKVAEIAEKYLQKGTEVAVEGKLINKTYLDKEGIKRTVYEIQINELLLLSSKRVA
jgi:single-strand DNA-binding protein